MSGLRDQSCLGLGEGDGLAEMALDLQGSENET